MAPRRPKRPSARVIAKDRATIEAIKELPDYAPRNPACSVVALIGAEAAMTKTEQRVSSLERALEQARFEQDAATLFCHTLTLDAKAEVIGQYGRDSAEVLAIGLTPVSARRSPARREKPTI